MVTFRLLYALQVRISSGQSYTASCYYQRAKAKPNKLRSRTSGFSFFSTMNKRAIFPLLNN